jgi:hypothetical protein
MFVAFLAAVNASQAGFPHESQDLPESTIVRDVKGTPLKANVCFCNLGEVN